MGTILSVNPEIFRLDVGVAHAAVSTAAQNPDILQVSTRSRSKPFPTLDYLRYCSPKQLDAFFTR